MALASIFNLQWNEPANRARFSFNNWMEHQKIQEEIFRKHGIDLPLFPIDPIPNYDLLSWAFRHQSMHSAANVILGLQGFDLTGVDFRKPEEVTVWTENHAREHMAINQALGIS